jgi:hypothetical protein
MGVRSGCRNRVRPIIGRPEVRGQVPRPEAGARSHGLGARQTSVDLDQRQRSFGDHAMFSRT